MALCLSTAILSMPDNLGLQEGQEKKTLLQALGGFDFKGSALLTISTTSLILGLVSRLLSNRCLAWYSMRMRIPRNEYMLTIGVSHRRTSAATSYLVSPPPMPNFLSSSPLSLQETSHEMKGKKSLDT